jgi:outer membrane protein assembly factor BamB
MQVVLGCHVMTVIDRWWIVIAAVTACSFASLASLAAQPDEPWSRWRGADGAGMGGDARFSVEWADGDWAWTADLPGTGNASPVVWQNHVYNASADVDAGVRTITCHDLADGRLLWAREFPGAIDPHHVQNSSASGSVAADVHGIYWMWGTRERSRVESLDHDGKSRWHMDLGPFAAQHGYGATPTVCRDVLIVPDSQDATSRVLGLDAASGRERWRLERKPAKADYSTPLVMDRDGEPPVVILTSMGHGVTAVDGFTGKVLWEERCLPKRAVSSPITAGDLLIGTSGDGGGDNTLVAVRPPEGEGAPKVAYTLDRSIAPYVPTPLHVDGLVYLWNDRGVVTCIRAATGETVWRGRVGGTYYASPIAAGGTVRNISVDGEAVTIRAGEAFEVLGRTDLGEPSRSTPAVVGRRMVFRTVGRLMALDAEP